MTRAVLNYHTDKIPDDAIWIMRPSQLGNPFVLGKMLTREESLKRFRQYLWHKINTDQRFRQSVLDLREKTLVCCCSPKPCHGHLLHAAADWIAAQDARSQPR